MMLTLYYAPGACSLASHIALEEAGADYRLQLVDFGKAEQRGEPYREINPQGRVPALAIEGDGVLTENVAILSYIAASYPAARLLPTEPLAYARALSVPGRLYAMYFDGSGPIAVTLDLPAGAYSGDWINTQTGSVERAEKFRHRGGPLTLQTPAFQDGIALRLNRTAQ